mmetsp:Transcript_3004/g.11442  ORF Transcript_3004/g.11442 Transcript_3004/m.11442 type:complete len:180 (+) Transcript_3004:73-612(+)
MMSMGESVDVPALTKGLSLCVGVLVIICCIVFMAGVATYLSVVVGLETMIFAIIQLVIEVQAPEAVIDKLRTDLPTLLSAPAQVFLSVVIALFLFAMGAFGIAMAVILICTVAINVYVAVYYPDAMPNRYSAPIDDAQGGPPQVFGETKPAFAQPYEGIGAPADGFNPAPHAQPSTADL